MLLAGDIGGTKTNLAIFSPEAGPRAPLAEATFPSADYPSLEALVREFLSQVDLKVERASFGVAGPVAAGRAEITNLPWVMDETQLQEALNLSSVRLLNDLASIAHAVHGVGADRDAPAAQHAAVWQKDHLRFGTLRFGAVAPAAGERAAFEIDSHADARPVVDGKGIDVKEKPHWAFAAVAHERASCRRMWWSCCSWLSIVK